MSTPIKDQEIPDIPQEIPLPSPIDSPPLPNPIEPIRPDTPEPEPVHVPEPESE